MGSIVYGIFQGLIFVIIFGSLLFVAYVVTRYVGNKTSKVMKGKHISIVETVSLGLDKQLYLLKAGEQFILISSCGKHIEFLTTVKLDSFESEGILDTGEGFNFKNFFEKYLQTFVNRKDSKEQKENPVNNGGQPAKSAESNVFKSNLNKLRAEKELLEVTLQYYDLVPLPILHELIKGSYMRKQKEAERRYLKYKRVCSKNPIIFIMSY